ncbi:MAG: hypothetical protein II359_05480 [Clostridia bacterium]|nr:hypothetical protein [Clostridia bacterium]
MIKMKRAILLMLFSITAIIGSIGYLKAGYNGWDTAYMVIRMYLFDADTFGNNLWIEAARWTAPIFTVSGVAILMKKFIGRIKDFFVGFSSDSIALYGDAEMKTMAKANMKHAIIARDNEPIDAKSHMIMFGTDEKCLEFYKKNKEKLHGEVFIKLEKNDILTASLDDVKFFNFCEITARSFWQDYDIRRVIHEGKMKIAIVGSDVLARKILAYGLLNNVYSLSQEIEYHVFSNNHLFEEAHSDFETLNSDRILYRDNQSTQRLLEIASADRIIITDLQDNEVMSEIVKMTKGEIYCFDPNSTFVNIFEYEKIYPFGQYTALITEKNIRHFNQLAKELNYQYAVAYAENPATIEEAWDKLDTFTKGSNIAAMDYHKIRLIVMRETGKSEADEALSEMEHIRWCRYHFINHWKYGETANGKKDRENKIHPCLKPYSELKREDQIKDKEGIQVLLALENI